MNTDRQILQHCLNLIGRLSPRSIESHLLTLLKLLPFVVQSKLDAVVASHVNADEPWHSDLVMALSQELLNLVDVPLKIITDEESKKKEEFLISEYNRDGDAYRSPFSNRYILPNHEACSQDDESMETLYFPGKKLRLLEILMNDAITVYRDMYYNDGGISSVYCWDIEDIDDDDDDNVSGISDAGLEHFACAVLLKKAVHQGNLKGTWDSIHIFEMKKNPEKKDLFMYKLTSTILVNFTVAEAPLSLEGLNMGGNLTRSNAFEGSVTSKNENDSLRDHVIHMGRALEEMESKLRSSLQEIYFSKSLQAISSLYPHSSSLSVENSV